MAGTLATKFLKKLLKSYCIQLFINNTFVGCSMTPKPWKVSSEKAVMTQEVMVSGASFTKRAVPSVLLPNKNPN